MSDEPFGIARLRTALRDLGVPAELVRPDVALDRIAAEAGEPALVVLLLHVESWLPEPFPVALLEQVDTLGELLAFAEVKATRGCTA